MCLSHIWRKINTKIKQVLLSPWVPVWVISVMAYCHLGYAGLIKFNLKYGWSRNYNPSFSDVLAKVYGNRITELFAKQQCAWEKFKGEKDDIL